MRRVLLLFMGAIILGILFSTPDTGITGMAVQETGISALIFVTIFLLMGLLIFRILKP